VRRFTDDRRRVLDLESAPDSGPESPVPHALIALQRQAGNRAVGAMLARTRGNQRGKKGGGGKKPGGGGKKPGGGGKKEGDGGTAVKVKKPTGLEKELATAKTGARTSAQTAARHANAAVRLVGEADALVVELQDLLTMPIVTSNADVKDAIEAALRDLIRERDGTQGHATTAGTHRANAEARASEAEASELDEYMGAEAAKDLARRAAGQAAEAERARDRAELAHARAKRQHRAGMLALERVAGAKEYVETQTLAAVTSASDARRAANTWNVGFDDLETLRAEVRKPVEGEKWRERKATMAKLEEEAERITGYIAALDDAETRILAPGFDHAAAVKIRPLITDARLKLRATPRDNAACVAALTKVSDELDLRDEAEAAAAGTAAARATLIAEGRLAANRTEIAAEAHASLAGEEKTAVDEILDGVKDGDTVSPFGGKWNDYHGNNGGDLPGVRGGGGYTEFYVRKPGGAPGWGLRRLVRNTTSGRWYYSRTHYGSAGKPAFVLLTGV
jgi:guanyl-specific ribonuclease Sa